MQVWNLTHIKNTANIQLHTFMSTYMCLKVTTMTELLICDSQVKSMKYHQGYIQQMYCYFSLKHNSRRSQFLSTSLKVPLNARCKCEIFSTQKTDKLFVVQMHTLMLFQFSCCIETLLTMTANIRLHTFMSTYMSLKATTISELLLTNVTHQPSTFVVWLQQMLVEPVMWSETFWTMSTWVRLCTSVNTNMTLLMNVCLKQLPTVRTVIWSSVAVYLTFMWLQVAGLTETFVTHWTLVWLVSIVDSHAVSYTHLTLPTNREV